MRILIEAGAVSSTVNLSPHLHHLAEKGEFAILKCFIEQGYDSDIRDKEGRSLLDWAELKGHRQMADWLRKLKTPQDELPPQAQLKGWRGMVNRLQKLKIPLRAKTPRQRDTHQLLVSALT